MLKAEQDFLIKKCIFAEQQFFIYSIGTGCYRSKRETDALKPYYTNFCQEHFLERLKTKAFLGCSIGSFKNNLKKMRWVGGP